ncbi:unnamed protein product [Darwinula stevensoni]|uniref:BEN domain-containing protein n=1 Tax=Darwinula stevensoni TaxID=69355 RepID=A0A7R9FRE2_9CRUS|nr:unnamed protein product [Darwinula stevensoni]CAG0901487.1 unnamed protein product [Darwinula stevensoni]
MRLVRYLMRNSHLLLETMEQSWCPSVPLQIIPAHADPAPMRNHVATENIQPNITDSIRDGLTIAQQEFKGGDQFTAHEILVGHLEKYLELCCAGEKDEENCLQQFEKLHRDLTDSLLLHLSKVLEGNPPPEMGNNHQMEQAFFKMLPIIEKEDAMDARCIESDRAGLKFPWRPMRWKEKVYLKMETLLPLRIKNFQPPPQSESLEEFISYLKELKQMACSDIRVLEKLASRSPTPHYNICKDFIQMYHRCLANQLKGVIPLDPYHYKPAREWVLELNSGSEEVFNFKDEYAPIWNEWERGFIMKHEEHLSKTLDKAVKKWHNTGENDDDDGVSTLSEVVPSGYFGLRCNTTTLETIFPACIDQIIQFLYKCKDEVKKYKDEYIQDPNKYPCFTKYMVDVVNDMLEIPGRFYWHPENFKSKVEKLKAVALEVRDEVARMLGLLGAIDLEKDIAHVFNSNQLDGESAANTISAIMDKFFYKHEHLRRENLIPIARMFADMSKTAMLSREQQQLTSTTSLPKRKREDWKGLGHADYFQKRKKQKVIKNKANIYMPDNMTKGTGSGVQCEESPLKNRETTRLQKENGELRQMVEKLQEKNQELEIMLQKNLEIIPATIKQTITEQLTSVLNQRLLSASSIPPAPTVPKLVENGLETDVPCNEPATAPSGDVPISLSEEQQVELQHYQHQFGHYTAKLMRMKFTSEELQRCSIFGRERKGQKPREPLPEEMRQFVENHLREKFGKSLTEVRSKMSQILRDQRSSKKKS